jgi:hypothetical protein
MALKNLGNLPAEAIAAFTKEKLLFINRSGDVWVEECDFPKAEVILKKHAPVQENVYRFHGTLIRMPKSVTLEQRLVGASSPPSGKKGKITIHEYSRPSNGLESSDRARTVETVKIRGEEIKTPLNIFPPGYYGIVMSDDDCIPLFEVAAYDVWVLFDTRSSQESTKKIYDHMLMFAIVLANHVDEKSTKVWKDIWASQATEREKLEIKQFIAVVSGSIKGEIEELESRVSARERQITKFQQSLYAEEKALFEERIRTDALKKVASTSLEEKAHEEWNRLRKLERSGAVTHIRVASDRISFTTREIKWTPKKSLPCEWECPDRTGIITITEPVRLGAYEVTVRLTDFNIEIRNVSKTLTYQGEHWHHPHVKDGNLCKGNMTDILPRFAAKREFEAVIMCVLKWLENVDTSDAWGRYITEWVKDDQARREEEKKSLPKPEVNVTTVEEPRSVSA